MRIFHVYFMASNSGTLYVGVTGGLEGRVEQHKKGEIEGFTKKYKCNKLVYFEEFDDVEQAILREKQIKKWSRYKKEALVRTINPGWRDLSEDWKVGVIPRPNRPRDLSNKEPGKEIPRALRARNDKQI